MSRALWKGAISFGLIHIPVVLTSAARERGVDLDLLDRRDFAPVGYRRYNKSTGEAVEWEDVVKGYQYEKGEYVVLTDEDFRLANVEATRTVDIEGFVERDAIAPQFYESPYYLHPDPQEDRVYRLFHAALGRTRRTAIARIVMRTRQYLCAVMPQDELLLLNTLRFADEILPALPLPNSEHVVHRSRLPSRELSLAMKLIEDMTQPWQPEAYRDTYREDLMRRIEEKIRAHQTHTLTPSSTAAAGEEVPQTPGTRIVPVSQLLRQSLAARARDEGPGRRRRGGPAPRANPRRRRPETAPGG